jgi:hypothetical protein
LLAPTANEGTAARRQDEVAEAISGHRPSEAYTVGSGELIVGRAARKGTESGQVIS